MISGKGRKQKATLLAVGFSLRMGWKKSPSNFEGVSPQGDGVVYICVNLFNLRKSVC